MFQTDDDGSEFKIFYSWSVTRNSRCVTRIQINNESTSDQIMTLCLLATTDHNAYISYVTAADRQCRIQESSSPSDQRNSSNITSPACSPFPDLSAKNLLQEYFANELCAGTLHNNVRVVCRDFCKGQLSHVRGKNKFKHEWLYNTELAYCQETDLWWLVFNDDEREGTEGCTTYCVVSITGKINSTKALNLTQSLQSRIRKLPILILPPKMAVFYVMLSVLHMSQLSILSCKERMIPWPNNITTWWKALSKSPPMPCETFTGWESKK